MILDESRVKQALDRHTTRLTRLPNVVGLGITRRAEGPDGQSSTPCIAVYVSKKVPAGELGEDELVPEAVEIDDDRVPTRVIEVGHMRKEQPSEGDDDALGGFSKEGG